MNRSILDLLYYRKEHRMLGKQVLVHVDRPLGSIHPECKDIRYPINYGYIPNTISPIDSEEIDAYILDLDYPIDNYEGQVIAIIHREADEDKLVVSNQRFSKEEIYNKTYFIEQYFNSHIEMLTTTKEDLLFDLKRNGIKREDTLMIHSSLKSFGNCRGEDIIAALQETVDKGLLIFPTHTWATIREDHQVFEAEHTPSCVGALTNIALKTNGFKRSLHPTHSVCAYGVNKDAYLDLDLHSTTPVSPQGCFGALKAYDTKILFMGAPLTKNTFIHSIEEEFQVEDRFTDHIYHFTSKGYGRTIEYYMPRHYSTKNAHLSEHYQKLLPHLLKQGIAKKTYIGNSKTYMVDARKCYHYVKKLLEKNIHLFDDYEDYED